MKRYKDLTIEERREYHREKHRQYVKNNPEKYREIARKSYKKFIEKQNGNDFVKQRNALHNPINNLLKSGKIKRENCFFCDISPTEAHHCDENKPLDVTWMCKICHEKYHQLLKITKIK